jgi:hypothetical protein
MNMKSLTVVLGALTALALGACKVETTGSTSTGVGGGSTTAGVGGAGGTGGAAATTGAGGAACDEKYTCAEAIDPATGDPAKLCEGPSAVLYDALAACTCDTTCKSVCGDNTCAGMSITAECTTCLQAAAPDGCKTEFDACANDAG